MAVAEYFGEKTVHRLQTNYFVNWEIPKLPGEIDSFVDDSD